MSFLELLDEVDAAVVARVEARLLRHFTALEVVPDDAAIAKARRLFLRQELDRAEGAGGLS